MTSQARPGGRTARVRARILTATVELVARDGIAGFRYEELAELAGVHKTSVYRNWPDRGELVTEALAQYAEREAPFADTGDLRADLVEFLLALAATLRSPDGRALLAATRPTGHDAVHRIVHGVLDRRLAAVQQRLELARRRGELPATDTLLFTNLVSGPVHLYLARERGAFGRTEAERIADVVLAGIRATGMPDATGAR